MTRLNSTSLIGLMLLSATVFTACSDKKVTDYDFKKTDNGLEYHFIEQNPGAKTGENGDIYTMNCEFLTEDDSVVLSQELRFMKGFIRIRKDFQEALSMLHVGDSAIFRLPADTFYAQHRMKLHPAFKPSTDSTPGDKIYVRVGVIDIQNETAYKVSKFNEEIDRINRFVERKNWDITLDTNSGVRYEILNRSKSDKDIDYGDTTVLQDLFWYTTDEDIIEKQRDNDTWEFVVGDKYNRVEGLSILLDHLREGDKVRAIIPFDLAYGEDGFYPHVKPYATICLELEIQSVRKKAIPSEQQPKDSIQ